MAKKLNCGSATCPDCGVLFTKNSGVQKRCKECAWKALLACNKRWNERNREKLLEIYLNKKNRTRFSGMRYEILERDNYTCQKCGAFGGKLNVHHLDHHGYGEKTPNNDPANLITLCHSCHLQLHNLGDVFTCKRCGIQVAQTGRNQLYCHPCKAAVDKEARRIYSLTYNKKRKLMATPS